MNTDDALQLKRLETLVRDCGRARITFRNHEYFIFVVSGAPQGPNEINIDEFKELRARGTDVFNVTLMVQKFFRAKITKISKEDIGEFQTPIIEERSPHEESKQLSLW